MARMVRKQIYIERRHQALLARMAEKTGTSEAQIIRQALDWQSAGADAGPPAPDLLAWEKALHFMERLHARGPLRGRRRPWRRDDAYEERLSRHARRSG